MNIRSVAMLVLGILIGVTMQAVIAKGDARITISGGDLPNEIEITDDACLMNALMPGNIDDHTMLVRTPPHVEGDGYLITRYDLLNNGDYQPFNSVRFYFDPRGGYGYVQNVPVEGSSAPLDNNWYRPTRQSQFVIEYILTRARARLPISGGG